MAGIGSSWGTREEMLHPRDSHGRFRSKWKMAAGVVDALTGFLDRFQPRQFQSDQQASQYSFNKRKSAWTSPELQRLHTDWDDANESLQAGQMDPTTKRFVDMMDRNMVETTDDLIVSQTVPTEAFGLSPQQAALEDGGLEDLIGLEIADAGYSAANLGSELSHPPGSVTLRVAVPKGTRVAHGGRSPSDRAVIFDRDQPLVVTKVEKDGRGGYYMLAIAGSGRKTAGATAVAQDRTHGRRGGGLTPEQREARVTPQMSGEERLRIAQQNEREMQTGPSTVTPAQTPAPAASPASPQTPAPPASGVPERREPVQSESVGPGSPEGKSASDIATDAETARVQAENAPPAPAAAPTPLEFQEATRDLPIPTSGPQRNEWNKAHSGLAQGKRDPGDVLRELDTDIEENKRKAASATHAEKKDSLERNIQAQEQLAGLIAEKYGVQRRSTSAPVARKAPAATPGAPSTARGAEPKVKAPEAAPDRRTKAQLLEEAGDAGRPRMTKDQLRKAIESKKGGDEAPKKAAPETRTEMRKRTAGPGLTDEQKADIKAKAARTDDRMAKEQADFDAKNKADLDPLLETAGLQEGDLDDLDKTGASLILGQVREKKISKTEGVRRLKASKSEQLQKLGDALEAKPRKAAPAKAAPAKKAVPAKAAPTPEDAAEEAFKARVAEAGLPDRVADLKAMAKDQKIRGFSTMNKKQLQSALLGDEVKASNKIGVVPPAKMVPHLEAAKSDQDARALLEKHTLVDLKALAKHREIKLPSKGATKGKVTDMVLEDIRGPQTGIEGRTPDTSLGEDLGNLGYIDLPGANGNQISEQIAQVDGDDPDSLRQRRDDLEKLSKQFRKDGDKDAANMAQAAADAMGMRAQTISGVEEGAPPVKRVAKKAVPEVDADAPEVERPIEKMLKPELLALATKEGASVRPSWSKARILDEIKKNRRMDSSRGPETDEERLRRELGGTPGGAERDLGPTQGPLQIPDRAPTPEEIAKAEDDARRLTPTEAKLAVRKTAKKAAPQTPAEDAATEAVMRNMEERQPEAAKAILNDMTPEERQSIAEARERHATRMAKKAAPAKKATKKAAKKAAADVERVAGDLAGQVRATPAGTGETFGDQLRGMDPEELRQAARTAGVDVGEGNTAEEIFDNTIKKMLESRMRELGMLPEDPAKPTRAQKRVPKGSVPGRAVTTPDRKQSFREGWDGQGFIATGTAASSMDEVRDDIESGKITPEEGVRRLDGDILFNEDESNDLLAELEGMDPDDRENSDLNLRRAQLEESIRSQKKAKTFIREHFKDEAPITREELEVQLDPEEMAAMQRVRAMGPEGVADLKRGAKAEGLGDIEGDDLDTVVQNVARAVAARELKTRAAAKAVPAAAPEAPAKKATRVKASTPRAQEAFDRLDSNENPPDTEEAQALLAPLNKSELVSLARGVSLPNPGGRNMADLRASIIEATSGRRRASIATRGFTGDRPGEGGLRIAEPTIFESPPVKRAAAEAAPRPGKVVRAAGAPPGWKARKIGDDTYEIEDSGGKVLGTLRQEDYENIVPGDNGIGRIIRRKQFQFQPADGGRERPVETAKLGDAMSNLAFERSRTPAPAPAPKAAVPAKAAPAPPKVVDLKNPTRHDAEVIGTGLDIDRKGEDRQWMDAVQSELDAGVDGRQIADGLRREADSQRTLHNITESVAGTEGASPSARVNRMELMADRLEGVRPIKKAAPPATAKATKKKAGGMDFSPEAAKAMADALSNPESISPPRPARKAAPKSHLQPTSGAAIFSDDPKIRAQAEASFQAREARKDLTGPIGEIIANQLNDTVKRVTEAGSDQEANDAISGLLTPELKQLAQRVGVSTGGSKELIRRRITERLRGTEAPTTSAERAVPQAPGGMTTQAPKPHSWGTFGQRGDQHYYHPDGEIPRTMARLGADAQIDVGGGESLHNAMGDIASDMVMGRISGDAGVARLRALATKLPAGSGARSRVAGLADDLDRPAVAMPRLPDQTPGPVRRLLQQVMTFPIARATGQYGGASFDKSLVDKIADFVREKASGESSIVGMGDDLARLILNHTHESQEGSMGLRALTQPLFKDDSEIAQALLAWAKEIRARRRAT